MNLVSKLRPWVTTFSEAIRYQCQHKDELRVGGKIVRIFNLADIMGDEKEMAYLTLDDDVGQISLMVPGSIYNKLNSKYSFKEDMVVLADGKLLDPEGMLKRPRTSKGNTIEPPPCATLVCWNIEPYVENEVPKEE